MNQVVVNGKHYELPDDSVTVINDKVYLNGKLVGDEYVVKKKKPSWFSNWWHDAVDRLEDVFDDLIDWLDDLVD